MPERRDVPQERRSVQFRMASSTGFTTHHIACIDAPTLTACGLELKHAADIPANYSLGFHMDPMHGDRPVGDAEAVVLQPDGSSQFIAWPPAHY